MKTILNHYGEKDASSQRSGGIAIVKKEFLPTYRQNEREKSTSYFDPVFQAKMRPIDSILQNEIDKIFKPKDLPPSPKGSLRQKSAKKMFSPVTYTYTQHFTNLDNSLQEKLGEHHDMAQSYKKKVVSK